MKRLFLLLGLLSSPVMAGTATNPSGATIYTQDVTCYLPNGSACSGGGGGGSGGTVDIDQTTPGTTNGVVVNASALPTGAATAAGLTTINSTLGSPFQVGGSIGNTSFGATQATASNLNAQIVGNAASAAADSGNPVKVGAVYNSSAPTFTNGQRGNLQIDAAGQLKTVGDTAPLPATTDRSGTATTSSGGLTVAANSARRGLIGQNISAVNIGFNEQGGTAAIGTAGTYTVPAGASFSISTNKAVNFIAASGTAAVTMTEW